LNHDAKLKQDKGISFKNTNAIQDSGSARKIGYNRKKTVKFDPRDQKFFGNSQERSTYPIDLENGS